MIITGSSDRRQRTVSDDAVYAKFASTPLQGYEALFLSLANRYGTDPNWALSYLQWESGFAASEIGRANPTNPWDILCHDGWGVSGRYQVGNYCYAVYPDLPTGLEAGFRLWSTYPISWYDSLLRAVGAGGEQWVNSVIGQGQDNANKWPYDGVQSNQSQSGQPQQVLQPSSIFTQEFFTQPPVLIGIFAALLLVGILSLNNRGNQYGSI